MSAKARNCKRFSKKGDKEMANAYISQATIDGTAYDLRDEGARDLISELQDYTDYLGVTTTELTDGATTNPVTINGESVTAKKGNIVNYGSKEFIFNGSAWQEFGDLSGLGTLAFENSAQGTYTPQGDITGTNVSYSPTTGTVNSITDVGTLPSLSVTDHVLTFNAGTLPTKGDDQSVLTALGDPTVTQGTFSGTQATITVAPAS